MFTDLIGQMDDMLDAILERELLDKTADVYKVMLDKMMDRGFSREEAIQIMARQGAVKMGN